MFQKICGGLIAFALFGLADVDEVKAVALTIEFDNCIMPSGGETACANLDVAIPVGDPLWVDFELGGAPMAHLLQVGNDAGWNFRFELTDVVSPGSLAVLGMNGVIPGLEAVTVVGPCNQCSFFFEMNEPVAIHGFHLSEVSSDVPVVLSEIIFLSADNGNEHVKGVWQVPEPGTLALFGLGLAGLGFARRRRKST